MESENTLAQVFAAHSLAFMGITSDEEDYIRGLDPASLDRYRDFVMGVLYERLISTLGD